MNLRERIIEAINEEGRYLFKDEYQPLQFNDVTRNQQPVTTEEPAFEVVMYPKGE